MRVLAIGEGMAEFRTTGPGGGWAQGYGGDVLNTAIHMARFGHRVQFASALGTDAFSLQLRAAWQAQGLDLSLLASDAERQCGIYFIHLDARGERSFTYWRRDSAARHMLELIDASALSAAADEADLVYLSMITLAILSATDRVRLADLVTQARRAGALFAFDTNYRPALWDGIEDARHWHALFAGLADIALPTLEDEIALGLGADPAEILAAWRALGCTQVALKLGAEGAMLPNGMIVAPERAIAPVDTSGAGDAFNAAYLSARLNGRDALQSAREGNRLAGRVIEETGAIPALSKEAYAPWAIAGRADG